MPSPVPHSRPHPPLTSPLQSEQLGSDDRAVLAELLQHHGVVVKGGQSEALKLLESLIVSTGWVGAQGGVEWSHSSRLGAQGGVEWSHS